MFRLRAVLLVTLCVLPAATAQAESICDTDGVQASGSIYRICMPPPAEYNGMLVIWAHGFQDAGTPVGIPEDQLCVEDFCIPDIVNGLGFGFATNSYSKTGMAIIEGKADILDLVDLYAAQKGQPSHVFLVGASEGGIITALSVERHPDVYDGGLAACGPVGDFPFQINYFGDARATFEYFFPGVIPGDPFNPDPALVAVWTQFYDLVVEPIVFAPANRTKLDEWVRVARLPFDPADYLGTVAVSARDVLRYSVVNLADATATIGGFPYDNIGRVYTGSSNDILLNLLVQRVAADPAAVETMRTDYATSGILQRPVVTLHTRKDQQVPYVHEQLYMLKTIASGAFLTRHLNIPIDRFEHCNFTPAELLVSFAIMLNYAGVLGEISGVESMLSGEQLAVFESRAKAAGVPYRREGHALALEVKRN
jgi:pimeloyl-ACP methyl ester carboxylesterase